MAAMMNIGSASRESGVSVKMMRHYESIGLLPRAKRSEGNYRLYGPNEVHSLRFIKRARELGFAMEDIRALLALWQDRSRRSASVKKVVGAHVTGLKRKIAEMESMVKTLEHLAHHCHGDHRPECPILDDLAQEHGAHGHGAHGRTIPADA